MHFSSRQKRLLKKLRKKSRPKSKLKSNELKDLVYLGDNGLIRYEGICENEHSLKPIDHMVHIQPKGEAECAYFIEERRRWLIPVLISIAALIISICAIISSSQTISVYIDNQSSTFSTEPIATTIIVASEK